jgi:signal transduction histidine kinase
MHKKCWEELNCGREDCPSRQSKAEHCWLSDQRVCIDGQQRNFRERLYQLCRDCPHFQKLVERSTGRRITDQAMTDTMFKLLEEMGGFHAELTTTNRQLSQSMRDLAMLNEVTKALQSTLELDQVLHIILTGLTAAQALSLNRAFLLLVDKGQKKLAGRMAVGPASPQEAFRIWNELQKSPRSFRELALTPYHQVKGNEYVNQLVRKLEVPLAEQGHILVQALVQKKTFLVGDRTELPGDRALMEKLGVASFAVVPLLAEQESLGVVIADNAVTRIPITTEDLTLLEIFAGQVSAFIRNAALYEQLKDKVAELNQSREKLLKAERMAAIGEIAATLAHEIRTPMVSIGGFVNSMMREMPGDNPYAGQLKIISAEIDRLEGVLADTLEVARFREPEMVRENINETIGHCLSVLKPVIDSHEIKQEIHFSSSPLPVWMDRHQFPQVILNILKNSIHAMPLGGVLSVRTVSSSDAQAIVEISDTGAGMNKQVLDHIFEPKFTTKKSGLGIGLAVSKKIVESHSGKIMARSAEGKGTVFIITLPLGGGS